MRFIDTHVHLNDEAFAGEEEQVIARALGTGVEKMLLPDIDSKERDRMFSISGKHPGVLYTMLGLYPGSVDASWERELEILSEYEGRGAVAIGEIGLDYHYSTEFAAQQKLALKYQLELADRLGLSVNIHLRDAEEDFVKVLHSCRHLNIKGNLHAFGGSYETFMRISKYGEWSVGIGGVVTFKNARVAESVKKIPLDRILLETDAPYLAPVPYRGKRNESSFIPEIAAKVAELKNTDIEEIASVTAANAERLFPGIAG